MLRSANLLILVAGTTGLEPAISGLTGQCVNQLHHAPTGRISLQCNVFISGGRDRARTCDPLLVRQMLSQLSYPPEFAIFNSLFPTCQANSSTGEVAQNIGLTGLKLYIKYVAGYYYAGCNLCR